MKHFQVYSDKSINTWDYAPILRNSELIKPFEIPFVSEYVWIYILSWKIEDNSFGNGQNEALKEQKIACTFI